MKDKPISHAFRAICQKCHFTFDAREKHICTRISKKNNEINHKALGLDQPISNLVAEINKAAFNYSHGLDGLEIVEVKDLPAIFALVEPVIRAKVEQGYKEIVGIYEGMEVGCCPAAHQAKIIKDMYEIAANKLRK